MARGFIPSPLPSQSALAEMYNISRTTVRHILCHLCERGVLSQVNHDYQILRQPEVQDGFDSSSASLAEQNRLFEQAFFTMINQLSDHDRADARGTRQLQLGEPLSGA